MSSSDLHCVSWLLSILSHREEAASTSPKLDRAINPVEALDVEPVPSPLIPSKLGVTGN